MNEKISCEIIQSQIESINNDIIILHEQKVKLQEKCPHYEVTKIYNGDTGNWCKQDDCYWIDYKCNYCGKTWREDQ